MEEEYSRIVRKFYEVYRPLQKKYNLRSHMKFNLYGDNMIEIWEYSDEARKKCVCKVKEETDAECYKRAIEELENYRTEREGTAHGKGTDMERGRLAC